MIRIDRLKSCNFVFERLPTRCLWRCFSINCFNEVWLFYLSFLCSVYFLIFLKLCVLFFFFTWEWVNLERDPFSSGFVFAMNIYCVSLAFMFIFGFLSMIYHLWFCWISIFFPYLIVEVLFLVRVSLKTWL